MDISGAEVTRLSNGDFLVKYYHKTLDDQIVHLSKINPSHEETYGIIQKVFSVSVAGCMTSQLYAILKSRGAEVENIKCASKIKMGKDDENPELIESIDLSFDTGDVDDDLLEKAIQILNKTGCLISSSIEKGIKVSVSARAHTL
jgi:hypothetical protein